MIDSHAHVAFDGFDQDRNEVIARAKEADVHWIEIGTDLEQSRKAVELVQGEENAWATVGIHPSDITGGIDWQAFSELFSQPKVVAVGEVGIDLYHQDNLTEQLEALKKFIGLAREKNLPVVFHVRSGKGGDAHNHLLSFLEEQHWNWGVIHTFSGSLVQAEKYLALGLYLSFSGVVTFKNAGEIAEAARTMPLERMLVETDCPFLAPEPYRGKRNEPAYVKFVAEKIAVLRGLTAAEVERATEENTRRLFSLSS